MYDLFADIHLIPICTYEVLIQCMCFSFTDVYFLKVYCPSFVLFFWECRFIYLCTCNGKYAGLNKNGRCDFYSLPFGLIRVSSLLTAWAAWLEIKPYYSHLAQINVLYLNVMKDSCLHQYKTTILNHCHSI